MRALFDLGRRLAHALFGASICGLAIAAIDATWARSAAGEAAPAALSTFFAEVGVLAPVALLFGAACAVFGFVMSPREPTPSVRSVLAVM